MNNSFTEEVDELEVLNLNDYNLGKLPEFHNLINLKELYCCRNQLTNLPESIGNLINLQSLSCWNNELTSLPESIGSLINLKKIKCDINQLKSLPNSFKKLINLESLILDDNLFSSVPNLINFLTKLRELHICRNWIFTFNFSSIENLENLEALYYKPWPYPDSIDNFKKYNITRKNTIKEILNEQLIIDLDTVSVIFLFC